MAVIAGLLALLLFAAACIWGFYSLLHRPQEAPDPVLEEYPAPPATIEDIDTGGVGLSFRAAQKYFYRGTGEEWRFAYLSGVNMGLTLPDTSLSNPDIPYDTYREWFGQIRDMNCNTVKVFTIMNPDFYRAFYDDNRENAENPLYLIQGIWINEDDMYGVGDAFGEDGRILTQFKRSVRETLDIIHGSSDYTSYGELEKAVYSWDVSPYVAGYVLGLEWAPDFVQTTNRNHPDKRDYQGQYLFTQSASPFEAFLCETGDTLIDYETRTYNHQTPVAFLNWSTTDPLTHTNEPFEEEDMVSLDTEHIRSSSRYFAGQFAAVDIYPYYPEFLNHQPQYLEGGNPYRAYLKDLMGHYQAPVVVAEFGVPTSRGIAHESVMGMNQGGMTERQQGEAVAAMLQDIAREGYAGAMIFSWQDEWFKQTWNTVRYAPEDSARRTPNVQSAEQSYGILACEPGKTAACLIDGSLSEWQGEPLLAANDGMDLIARADGGYLYLCIQAKQGFDFSSGKMAVAIGLTGRGNDRDGERSLAFSAPADFLLLIDGRENTRLLTDVYYDSFYYRYSVERAVFERSAQREKSKTGLFGPIRQFISNEMTLPLTGETIAPKAYESGLMRFGNANPQSGAYDSLADFCYQGNVLEIRIPWYLLNVMNASEKVCLADFFGSGELSFTSFEKIQAGACVLDGAPQTITMEPIRWSGSDAAGYRTRLKASYSIIQKALEGFMKR